MRANALPRALLTMMALGAAALMGFVTSAQSQDLTVAYVTPADELAGRAEAIWAARKQKLATANARRRAKAEKGGFARS